MNDIDLAFNPIEIAKNNPQSKALAIRAFCASCVGFPESGWREDIRQCTAPNCPLWTHRPYKPVVE